MQPYADKQITHPRYELRTHRYPAPLFHKTHRRVFHPFLNNISTLFCLHVCILTELRASHTLCRRNSMATAAPFSLIIGASGSKSFEFGLVRITPPRCLPSNFVWQKKAKLYGHVSCKHRVSARAEYNGRRESGGGDFLAGFLLGGVVFGALGFLFAPQISKTLWSGDEDGLRKKLARRMDDDEGLEKTRKTLNEKIAQLNSAIDDVSAQLRAADGVHDSAPGASEVESAA